ncbi:unnamed protein product [Alopecurus aequalis]
MARRPSIGHQKIEIRRIKSKNARQVCFSKRRTGLFKKASELAILCGVELAIVVFSPGRKPYSFGHPSVQAILERFDPIGQAGRGGVADIGEANRKLAEINRQYGEVRAQLDMEKARKKRLDAAMAKHRAEANPFIAWLEADLRDIGEEELVAFSAALAKVQGALAVSADKVLLNSLNQDLATMVARSSSSGNNQVHLPQQLLANNGVLFDQFGAGINNFYNNSGVDMHMQMMMDMAMPLPVPGLVSSGIETMMHEEFGFLGSY